MPGKGNPIIEKIKSQKKENPRANNKKIRLLKVVVSFIKEIR